MNSTRGRGADNLEEQIGRMRSQLASIRRGYREPPTAPSREAAEDLRATIEELYVAEEELRLEHEELLRARAEADGQRRRYEELFQLAPDAYVVTNSLGIVREANRAAADMLGVEPRFLVGKPLATFVAGDDRSDLRALINGFGAATEVDGWSIRLVPRDGESITVSVSASAARDARNELVGIRWIVRDVSEREHSDRQLLALADERQTLLDSAPEGICRLDRDGNIDYVNPAAARLLGRAEADLLGQPLIDVFVEGQSEDEVEGDDRVPLERALGAMRAGYGQWDYTSPLGGRDVAVRYECAPLTDAGTVVGAIVSLVDVTGRRDLERDLRRRAEEDGLTGLRNRRSFEEELERELAFSSRYGTSCAMLLLDVDDLKFVNDRYGHLAGDGLLRAVARGFRDRLRRTDIAGRLGGDEFGVLLPRAGERAARTVAAEVLDAVRAHPLESEAGDPVGSVSLGIAMVKIPGLRTTDVLRCADEAMYRAKRNGGDRIVVLEATLP